MDYFLKQLEYQHLNSIPIHLAFYYYYYFDHIKSLSWYFYALNKYLSNFLRDEGGEKKKQKNHSVPSLINISAYNIYIAQNKNFQQISNII